MGNEARKLDVRAETRIAVDPLTAVLPSLSALGCVCSIAATLWLAQEQTELKSKPHRKASVAVRDLETDCLVLQEVFRRLGRNLKAVAGDRSVVALPLKFGLHGIDIAPAGLMADIGRVLPSASQNAYDVMRAIEDGGMEIPETIFYGFGECQERLTKLVVERASVKVLIDSGLAIAMRVTDLVQDMKRHMKD